MDKDPTTHFETIYVSLPEEGVPVWRPVSARLIKPGVYQLDPTLSVKDHEVWEFQPGDKVVCEKKDFSNGTTGLVAMALEADAI